MNNEKLRILEEHRVTNWRGSKKGVKGRKNLNTGGRDE